MSAQSATAHTRREPGRSSVRQPAVRMSVRGTDRQDSGAGRFTQSDIRVGQQPIIQNFYSLLGEKKNTFIKVYNPCTEYLFIYVLSYL